MTSQELTRRINAIPEQVIGAAIEVHRYLGPGLLQSAYQRYLLRELTIQTVTAEVQVKAVEKLDTVHEAQLLTYLRLGGRKCGLLINFNVLTLKDGIRRRVLNLDD